jgi:DHA1 family tetracycline resistance protein-like MFS transporter
MTVGLPFNPARRKAALGFIFITALLDVLSIGIMIPVLPNLIKAFNGGDTASASLWNVAFATSWGLMHFLASPVIGLLSDRFGRRPVLLISNFGMAVDYLFMALAPSLALLWVGRVISGITAASFSTANAYIADVTPEGGRAKAYGFIGAAWSLGFLIGPAIGGALGEIDLRLPFYVAAGLAAANWLYGLLILPESLPPEKRQPRFDWSKANPLGSVRLLRRHRDLTVLATVTFLYQLSHIVLSSVFVLYTGFRYGWTPGVMGLAMMATGAANMIVQSMLVGRIVSWIGERGALLAGLSAFCGGFVIYALAPTGALYLLGAPVFAFSALVPPGLQGLMTRLVSPSEQGQLQGANSSIVGITALIGPSLFGLTFAYAVHHHATLNLPGLPILIAAALVAMAIVLTIYGVPKPQLSAIRAPES